MSKFVESKTRTNKLWCSVCLIKISKGDDVIFKLTNGGNFLEVYGDKCGCKKDYFQDVIEDSEHPYSSEALGQE